MKLQEISLSSKLSEQAQRIASLFPDASHKEILTEPRQNSQGNTMPFAVSAAWFGYDARDSTLALQKAIDSGATIVVIPALESRWILSATISLAGNQELIFEEGCRVEAAAGAFMNKGESLFEGDGIRQLKISGYGASWTMRKTDYQRAPYEDSQWRHALSLRAAQDIMVEGLTIASSGGDGVYLGTLPAENSAFRTPCRNITLSYLTLKDHHRQGISVISAENLLIDSCYIVGTKGTMPSAGIDFEPNSRDQGFSNCIIRDCYIADNKGPAILIALGRLSPEAPPLSIRVEQSIIRGSPIAFSLFAASKQHQGTIGIHASAIIGLKLLNPRGKIILVIQ